MQSPLPGNEAGRSRVLWNYRILDTPPEERFDDLVRVATYICGTPIGLVGLIDAGREWFKSRVGWDLSEIPREISFGTHTITQPDVLIVSDTLKDERFVRNRLATQAGVRFYAGAPLLTPEGYALGTLSVMDYVPRALTGVQTRILWALARQVIAHLEDRRDFGSNPERDSYERYRRFFESSVVGFYRTTLDGQLLDCNPAFVRIMGYVSREELLACHALEFYFSPSERQEFLEQCLTLGSLTNFASRLRRKDGSSVWVLENVETVPGRGGTPTMIEGTLVDISQQKSAETAHNKAQQALEDSETRYRRLFETAKDGILLERRWTLPRKPQNSSQSKAGAEPYPSGSTDQSRRSGGSSKRPWSKVHRWRGWRCRMESTPTRCSAGASCIWRGNSAARAVRSSCCRST